MHILDVHGIQQADFVFCGCPSAGKEDAIILDLLMMAEAAQLIEFGYWPASFMQPETAFSLDLMDQFQLLSNQANTNAYDYVNVLYRRTDNIDPASLPVRFPA